MLPRLCSDGFYKDSAVAKSVCEIDNPTHYEITDLAIARLFKSNPELRYLLVTNGDNYYGPSFLSEAVNVMEYEVESGKTKFDCVITDRVLNKF